MIWAFVVLNIVLSGLLVWEKYQNRLERSKFINALISKTTGEMVSLEIADKRKPEPEPKKKGEIYPVENMPEDEFDKFIDRENGK